MIADVVAEGGRGGSRLVLGFVLGIAAALAFGLGMVLQKRRAVKLPEVRGFSLAMLRAFVTDVPWLVATGIVLAAWVLEFAALLWAPVALVLPSMVVGVALMSALAVRWLGERLRPLEWAGVALCTLGVAAAGASLDPTTEASGASINGVAVVVAVACLALGGVVAALAARRAPRWAEACLSTAAGLVYAATGTLTKTLSISAFGSRETLVSGVVLTALIALSVVAVFLLQAAYQKGRAIVVVTVTGVLSSYGPAALGLVLFGEHWPEGWRGGIRWAALAGILAGFAMLARPAARIETASVES